MRIIKLLLFTSLVSNFSKIEKISDLNSIGVFKWDAEVTKNQNTKKDILDVLNKITAKEYLEQASNKTALLLNGTGVQDNHIGESLSNVFKDATELEKNTLQSKILKATGMILFQSVAGYLAVVGGVYYGIQGVKYAFAQMVQPYFDRWGKHREFLAKLKPLKIKELRNPVVGYNLMRKHIDRVIAELKMQVTSGKKIDMDGLFLYGKPGNGKTTWVEFIAYKTGLPLIVVNFNDLINSKSGTIEENLTLLFKELRKHSPCICFFDEIDLIVKGKPEILAQLLQELDGLKSKQGIFMIAATNEKDAVRESLLRPGRFGVHFEVANPILSDIQLLVDLYLNKKGIDLDEELSYDAFISSLQGLSCAGVRAYCNFLDKLCKENDTNIVTQSFIDEANFIYKR
jgi:hypothetical protein